MRSTSPPAAAIDPAFAARLRARPWRLIRTPPAAGAWNMALDAALLEAAARGGEPLLRLYAWQPPTLTLGRFQAPEGIAWEALRRRGWEAARRPTGGRAVLHHRELTYALVLPPEVVDGAGVRRAYATLGEGLRRVLALLTAAEWGVGSGEWGAPEDREPERGPGAQLPTPNTQHPTPNTVGAPALSNCFARTTEADCAAGGGKVLGSAQARRGGALLQHGSLVLDADRPAWRELFGSEGELRTLREVAGREVPPDEAAAAFRRAFPEVWGLELCPDELTPDELRAAGEAEERFRVRF